MKVILTIVGAIAGGVLGFFTTGWLARQGLYSVMIPGAFIGLGSMLGKGGRGLALPILLGICGAGMAYLAEWHYFPFIKDDSFSFFLANLSSLKPVTHLMAGLAGLIAFGVPFCRRAKPSK